MATLLLLMSVSQTLSANIPPRNGPYKCSHTEIHVGGYKAGGSQKAYLMWPDEASKSKQFPFLAFAHGKGAGGIGTYNDYNKLWPSVCSHGYIIAGPMSCPNEYCKEFYEDVITTISTCSEKRGSLNVHLNYANFSQVGVYGHSMGGGATVHVSDYGGTNSSINVTAAVALHPWLAHDKNPDGEQESKNVKIPMIWFTGNDDNLVPAPTVYENYGYDPFKPKLFAELKGVNHMDCTSGGPNSEDAYVALFFDCQIKRNTTACQYFWNSNDQYNICSQGPPMTKCQVDQK
eukprot:45516_1